MGFWSNLIGTSETLFKIGKGKATLDASGLTAPRTHVLPDKGGTLALVGPSFSAYMSASQTSGSGAFTISSFNKLNFDTARYDTAGGFNSSQKRYTPGVAGKYGVKVIYDFFASTGVTIAIVSIFKNGVEERRLQDLRGSPSGAGGGSDTIELSATDYIEVHSYLSATTVSINGAPAPHLTTFSVSYEGP